LNGNVQQLPRLNAVRYSPVPDIARAIFEQTSDRVSRKAQKAILRTLDINLAQPYSDILSSHLWTCIRQLDGKHSPSLFTDGSQG
jgi:hypothetical protein